MGSPEIVVREVWARNLEEELDLIQTLLQEFPVISVDTEYPGTIFTLNSKNLPPSQIYALMKRNVDALCLIQLGLTLSDAAGNLPGTAASRYVWQFNFADFDCDSHPHNPDSISLLKSQGMDFSKNRRFGIHSRRFALLFKISGLCMRAVRRRNLTWVTFHGAYDLGFLIKILTRRQLPDDLGIFMSLLRRYLGPAVYDLKPLGKDLGLHGGLEAFARSLMVRRAVGRSHQAGSDSLLTMHVFMELMRRFGCAKILEFNYKLFGLSSRQ